jgi:hypothetical protein
MGWEEEMRLRAAEEERAWQAFVATRDPMWRPLLEAIAKKIGMPFAKEKPDGTWKVSAEHGLANLDELRRVAPPGFELHASADDVWLDFHVESQSDFLVNPGLRATLSAFDHFMAGMSVTLTVYPTDEAYDGAMHERGEDEELEHEWAEHDHEDAPSAGSGQNDDHTP